MTNDANVTDVVPFFWVADIESSLRFYVDGIGFELQKRWIEEGKLRWCWLELGGAKLMLQELAREGPHTNVPQGPVGVGVSLNFICKDAVELYRNLRIRGLEAKRPFVGNSMWVTSVADPDGYALFFESPTDAAEETVYTDA